MTVAHLASASLGETFDFVFDEAPAALERWLSRHFDKRIVVRRDRVAGFPDDTKGTRAHDRLDGDPRDRRDVGPRPSEVDSIRDRLRTNLEVSGVPAFWEDRLFGAAADVVDFRIGDVRFEGTNPCARCVVPTRDALTGEPTPHFAKMVTERRAATLPAWANRERFDHYFGSPAIRAPLPTPRQDDRSGRRHRDRARLRG